MLGQPALPEQPFPSSFKEKAVCQPGSPSYQLSFAVLHGERNTKHVTSKCHDLWDPTAASISDRDCDTREGETVAMNYKPSPLQVKLGSYINLSYVLAGSLVQMSSIKCHPSLNTAFTSRARSDGVHLIQGKLHRCPLFLVSSQRLDLICHHLKPLLEF
ncbi:protein FAM219A isoform X5 [Rhea pennata]|uniref:protein FAM219A isoform X5 n=1 Tax=Rhea pennata TaxID=8795 RepID=UPI002E272200